MEVLYVIAQENFRDEEYFKPKKVLEGAGHNVTTASNDAGTCKGQVGGSAQADVKIEEVDPSKYDAVVVAGGRGSPEYLWENTELQEIIRDLAGKGKVVAAICLSSAVLAKAGVLQGRKATVFETPESVSALEAGKAELVREDVVRDANIVTANGPDASESFGKTILEALS